MDSAYVCFITFLVPVTLCTVIYVRYWLRKQPQLSEEEQQQALDDQADFDRRHIYYGNALRSRQVQLSPRVPSQPAQAAQAAQPAQPAQPAEAAPRPALRSLSPAHLEPDHSAEYGMSPQQHSRQPAPPYSEFSPSDMPVLPPYTAKGDRLSAEPIVMGQASSANSAASPASEPASASPSPPAAGAAGAAASASTSDAEATGSMPQFLAQPQPAHISGERP